MLEVELPWETQRTLEREAALRGVDVSQLVSETVARAYPPAFPTSKTEAERQEAIKRVYGSYAGKKGSVDEFLREKHAETERENERMDRWLK